MISFCGPCFKWKIIMAFKGHSGWNGFQAPYYTKYLNRRVRLTYDWSGLTYPDGSPISGPQIYVYESEFDLDRLTAQPVNWPVNPVPGVFPFPFFGEPIPTPQPPADGVTNWVVTGDTYFSGTHYEQRAPLIGLFKTTNEVFLSNQYTLEELDSDADALISNIDPNSIAWGSGMANWFAEDYASIYMGFDQLLLPRIAEYVADRGPTPPVSFEALPQSSLDAGTSDPGAMAGYVYAPSPFGEPILAQLDRPGAYMKFVAYVGLAGNYCQKQFYIDWSQNLIGQECVSGAGGCSGGGFLVKPPPIVVGQSAYTLIVPNCRC
jgi:hypothetical protein